MYFYINSSLTWTAWLRLKSKLRGKTIVKCGTRLHWLSHLIFDRHSYGIQQIFLWNSYWKLHHPVMNGCELLWKPILPDVLKKPDVWQANKTRTKPGEKLGMSDRESHPVYSITFYMEHQTSAIKTRTFYLLIKNDVAMILPKLLCLEWKCMLRERASQKHGCASATVLLHYFCYYRSLVNHCWAIISLKLAG